MARSASTPSLSRTYLALSKKYTPEGVPNRLKRVIIMRRFAIYNAQRPNNLHNNSLHVDITHVQVEVFLQVVIPLGIHSITDRDVMILSGIFED